MNKVSELEILELMTRLNQLNVPTQLGGTELGLWSRIMAGLHPMPLSLIPPNLRLSAYDRPLVPVVSNTDQKTKDIQLTNSQIKAWAKLQAFFKSKNRFFLLKGYAGTGKTFMIQKVLELYPNTLLSAPTNKATKVMTLMLNKTAKTIYSRLGITMDAADDNLVLKYPDRAPYELRGSTIVIDECSMVGQELLNFILKAAYELDLRIIFVGDPAQLRPVNEKRSPVWSLDIKPECKAILTEVKRFDDQLLVLATAIRSCLKTRNYDLDIDSLADQKKVIVMTNKKFVNTILKAGPKARVLAWRNKTVDSYNTLIRQNLGFTKPYCPGDQLLVASPFDIDEVTTAHIDDELLVTEAHPYSVNVENIDIPSWIVVCDYYGQHIKLTIPTDKGQSALVRVLAQMASVAKAETGFKRKLAWNRFWETKLRFNKVRYGFGMTCHRVQGSTLVDVFVDYPDIMANREQKKHSNVCTWLRLDLAIEFSSTEKM